MNKILEKIIESRGGHYCHCVEVNSAYELECIAENVAGEFYPEHTEEEILEFLTSLDVYALDDENEESIYEFSFREYLEGTL